MDAVLAKRYIGAVRTEMFDSFQVNLSGFLTSFVKDGDEYSYYRTDDFHEAQQKRGAVLSGYYKVEDFSNSITYPSVHTFSKLKKKQFNRFILAENGDTVKIEVLNTDLPYTFYTINYYEVTHDTNYNYVISGKLNKSILGTPTQVTYSTGIYSSGFYANHISGMDNISDPDEKVQYLIATIYCAMRVSMIDSTVFPILLDGGPDNIDTSSVGTMVESMRTAWENEQVLNNLTFDELRSYDSQLISLYDTVFLNQIIFRLEPIAKRVIKLMRIMSPTALALVDVPNKITALRSMLVGEHVNNSYYKFKGLYQNDEDFALKIINSIDINNQTEVDEFLGELIDKNYDTGNSLPPYQENLYTLLYDALENHLISDTANGDNTTRFIYAMLVLWSESKYNPYKNGTANPDFSLIDTNVYHYDNNYKKHFAIINYISKKGWFGTFNDKFTFSFGMHAHGIYYTTDESGTWVVHDPPMHFYQPITLVTYPSETDTAIQIPVLNGEENGAIPLFLLKYIDDYGDNETLNVKIGIFVDVVTTVAGLGALAKLKHLRHLSKLGQVATVIESVQVIAGVANLILSYTEACNNSEFCKKLKRVLTFIEMTSLVTDPLVIAKTRKSAQEVVEEGIENGWPTEMMDATHGTTPRQAVEELASLQLTGFWDDVRDNIRNNFDDMFYRSNLSVDNIPHVPPHFEMIHSQSEITNIINHGLDTGLSQTEIEALLLISCRKHPKDKLITSAELMTQMDNWKFIQDRKYPYKFDDLADFESFKNSLTDQISDWGIPTSDIRVQGSSLRNANANDVDIAIFINESDLASIKTDIMERLRLKYTENGKMNWKARKEYEKAVQKFEKNLDKGFINHYNFGMMESIDGTDRTFMQEFFNRDYNPTGGKVDVSIIIKDRNFDTPPYLQF